MTITLRNLMLLIAVVGIDLGASTTALRGGEYDWGILALLMVTTGLLATAILGATLRRGAERAVWLGVAVFGWAFLLSAFALTLGHAAPTVRVGIYLGAQAMAVVGGGIARLFSR